MTIRNWVKFAFWALLIGGVVTAVASLIIRWDFYQPYLENGEIVEFCGKKRVLLRHYRLEKRDEKRV